MVKERRFKEGDLVIKNTPHVLQRVNPLNKFEPKGVHVIFLGEPFPRIMPEPLHSMIIERD